MESIFQDSLFFKSKRNYVYGLKAAPTTSCDTIIMFFFQVTAQISLVGNLRLVSVLLAAISTAW